MPRDLESEKETMDNMTPLSREPDNDAPPARSHQDEGYYFEPDVKQSKRDELHPYVQTLNITNVESCVALEQAAFPPEEAATKEKFLYRLTVCGELCLGMFTSKTPPGAPAALNKDATENMAESTLVAHISATKTNNETITDDDMALPPKWQTDRESNKHLGHKEEGRTIAIHSLAVFPEFQNISLGSTILKDYIQRMHGAEIADRVALLAHEELVPFYEKHGFVRKGKSKATYGGGDWIDMVYEFPDESNLEEALKGDDGFDELE